MNIKDRLQYIINNNNPKVISKKIKNNPVLFSEILKHYGTTIAEKSYNLLHPNENICSLGKHKKFSSIVNGYKFCGTTKKCSCALESVSASVSKSKKKYSDIQKLVINEKRKNTNLKKYGVENAGQTPTALVNQKIAYSNVNKVNDITAKIKKTKLEKYGSPTYNNVEKTKDTNKTKYGFENVMQVHQFANKARDTRLKNYDPLLVYEKNYHNFCNVLKNAYGVITNCSKEDYNGIALRPLMTFTCMTCEFIFDKRFDYASPPVCKRCNPTKIKYQSIEEQQVSDYIKEIYDIDIVQNSKSIINPFELDIVIPELKIAIEYCGLYWHSEISGKKTWNYHKIKYNMCKNKGYRLITIFSDEWNFKQHIVKSKLKNILGLENGLKIGARKCKLEVIKYKDAKDFYNNYHIQGSPKRLGVSVGLRYNNNIVAIGSFVNKTSHYELVRFATSNIVQGGTSRIIKYFQKNVSTLPIVSFSDNRWSDGSMYAKLNFKHISDVPPMQSYVEKYQIRHHKLKFRNINKHNLTEWQHMKNNGYDRIWDCGKKKWILDL